MAKDPNFPASKWHPKTGEQRTFHSAGDVPDGWLDTHPDNLPKEPLKVTLRPESPSMTRKEIVAALTDGGITFDPAAKVVDLYGQLTAEVKRVLDEAGIAYNHAADTKALLELLPKPE